LTRSSGDDLPPSLHGHYPLHHYYERPPLSGASILSASRLQPLARFPLASPARFSRSVQRARLSFAPPTCRVLLRLSQASQYLSRKTGQPSVFDINESASTLQQLSACARLAQSHLSKSCSHFFRNVQHRGF